MVRKLYLAFLLVVFSEHLTGAQTVPQGINYQAVARDDNGAELLNQTIDVRFSVRQTTATGTVVYEETHATSTNQYGLFSLVIGQGSAQVGTFSSIDWGSDAHFLQVEVDPDGNGYLDMGTTQFWAVPYAMHAGSVDGGAGDRYLTSSTDAISIGLGALSLNVETGLAYSLGQSVLIASDSANLMLATVTDYDPVTGVLDVVVVWALGTGSFNAWSVNLSGRRGL